MEAVRGGLLSCVMKSAVRIRIVAFLQLGLQAGLLALLEALPVLGWQTTTSSPEALRRLRLHGNVGADCTILLRHKVVCPAPHEVRLPPYSKPSASLELVHHQPLLPLQRIALLRDLERRERFSQQVLPKKPEGFDLELVQAAAKPALSEVVSLFFESPQIFLSVVCVGDGVEPWLHEECLDHLSDTSSHQKLIRPLLKALRESSESFALHGVLKQYVKYLSLDELAQLSQSHCFLAPFDQPTGSIFFQGAESRQHPAACLSLQVLFKNISDLLVSLCLRSEMPEDPPAHHGSPEVDRQSQIGLVRV